MYEIQYKLAKSRERFEKCWFKEQISDYLTFLASQGYSPKTLKSKLVSLLQFAFYVQSHGVSNIADIPKWVADFTKPYKNYDSALAYRSHIAGFIRYLRREKLIPESVPKPYRWFPKITLEYSDFLQSRKCLCSCRFKKYISFCQLFFEHLRSNRIRRINLITLEIIQRFVILEGSHHTRKTMREQCTYLRSLLSYLYFSGRTRRDFSAIVMTPRIYRDERCPRFLTRKEIQTALSIIDKRTTMGKRDYAIILLLSTYGLRGIEVSNLRLDDIDWRTSRIYIRNRKAGNSSVYPLAKSAGEALLSYLRCGRPKKSYRQVFLSLLAPHKPISSAAIRQILKNYLNRAGIKTDRVGAHTLRYSCAQHLFEQGFSIKTIGDYLGHRSLSSTQSYIKIDITHLREVAINNGEALL